MAATAKANGSVRLVLSIGATDYRVTPIRSPAGCRAWLLVRLDGKAEYVASDSPLGAACQCGDSRYRHRTRGESGCKHLSALRKLGLIGPIPE